MLVLKTIRKMWEIGIKFGTTLLKDASAARGTLPQQAGKSTRAPVAGSDSTSSWLSRLLLRHQLILRPRQLPLCAVQRSYEQFTSHCI